MNAPAPPPVTEALAARDRRDDLRVLVLAAGALLLTFAIGATVQAIFVFRPERLDAAHLLAQSSMLPMRLLTNVATVASVLVACAAVRLNERRLPVALAAIVALSVAAGMLRHGAQLLLGIYVRPALETSLIEITSVAVVVTVSLLLALAQVRARARLREHERAAAEHRTRASLALAELATEEMRVRREVAEGLHGTLQGRLVVTQSALAALRRRGQAAGWDAADLARLDDIRRDLESIRERDVRELSQLVYPVGVDVGIAHAVQVLVRRLPADIAVDTDISPEAGHALDGTDTDAVGRRITLVRAVEEGITNALRHGAATALAIRIALDPAASRIVLTVDDDGTGAPETATWNGLARIAERLALRGGTAALTGSSMGGACLRVELPTSLTPAE
ncbi:sensor histidine kinase [Microbacterium luticocti]|uniref:sensor histidine kinase n=1 Tax=Microbacterium luticocti TaxID=451764 RepID=UPI0003FD2CED|nr:ATP-binding protein [Microbacterium luticocti]